LNIKTERLNLNRRYPRAYFLTIRGMMHRSEDRKKWDEEDVLFKK
jgi:hypothetical protein